MKKVVLSLVVFIILISSLSLATNEEFDCGWQNSCDNNQIQLDFFLNQENNAHGYTSEGTATGEFDSQVFCCDDEVNLQISTDSNTCNDENTIVWLNQENNAHAAIQSDGLYQTPVCIDGIKCITLNPTDGDEEDYRFVVATNQEFNAHLYTDPYGLVVQYRRYCLFEEFAAEIEADAAIENGDECFNGEDDDNDGLIDCLDPDCWEEIGCVGNTCEENSVNVLTWSYFYEEVAKGEKDASIIPISSRIQCCEENQCVYGNNCYDSGELIASNPNYICNAAKDWDLCGPEAVPEIYNFHVGDFSFDGNYYCSSFNQWIEPEEDCFDGLPDGGGIAMGPNGYVELTDCADPTCAGQVSEDGTQVCEQPELTCNDGFDNDGDSLATPATSLTPVDTEPEMISCEISPAVCGQDQYCNTVTEECNYKKATGNCVHHNECLSNNCVVEGIVATGNCEEHVPPTIEELEEEVGAAIYEETFNGCSINTCIGTEIQNKGIIKSVYLKGNKMSYVKLLSSALNNKEDFSISMWVNTDDQKKSAILSAANQNMGNEFIIFNPKKLTLYLKGDKMETNIDLTQGSSWKHLVITKEFKTIKVYVDGVHRGTLNQYEDGSQLNVEQLVLGQEQDVENGEFTFDSTQSYKGNIDEFKIYDHVLTQDDIDKLSAAEGLKMFAQALAGQAAFLPRQQTSSEESFFDDVWNKVKSWFGREEAIVGEGFIQNYQINQEVQQNIQQAIADNPDQYVPAEVFQQMAQEQLDDIPEEYLETLSDQVEANIAMGVPGIDCLDSDCISKDGPDGGKCCLITANCNEGAICGDNQECKEMECYDGIDNDEDNLTDCLDPDCQYHLLGITETTCSDGIDNDGDCYADCLDTECEYQICAGTAKNPLVCSQQECVPIEEAPQAVIQQQAEIQIWSYWDAAEYLRGSEVVEVEPSICNNVCQELSKNCIFADGGRKSCSQEGSTKCTCR